MQRSAGAVNDAVAPGSSLAPARVATEPRVRVDAATCAARFRITGSYVNRAGVLKLSLETRLSA